MKKKRTGVITVEATLVMPIVIGVIFLLYSIIVIQYNNILFRTTAIQITNRVGANWNQIVGDYTILTEDMNSPIVLSGQTSDKRGRTGKNVVTSESYSDNDPYAPILQMLGAGKQKRMQTISAYYNHQMTKMFKEDAFDLLGVSPGGGANTDFSVLEMILGGNFEITVENHYSNGLIDIVKGLGFDLKRRSTATVRASFNDPVEFVRNVGFVKEVIADLKEKKAKK